MSRRQAARARDVTQCSARHGVCEAGFTVSAALKELKTQFYSDEDQERCSR